MKTYKMKATADIRIRLADGVKTDVTKWSVVDCNEDQVALFIANGFVKADDIPKKWEIQTTDASNDDIVEKKGKKVSKK